MRVTVAHIVYLFSSVAVLANASPVPQETPATPTSDAPPTTPLDTSSVVVTEISARAIVSSAAVKSSPVTNVDLVTLTSGDPMFPTPDPGKRGFPDPLATPIGDIGERAVTITVDGPGTGLSVIHSLAARQTAQATPLGSGPGIESEK